MRFRWLAYILNTATLFSLSLTGVSASALEPVYIQPPRSATDATQIYYQDLLDSMLPAAMPLRTVPRAVTQERSLQLLDTGSMSVAWCGTNNTREQRFRAIRVPLFGGLLGVRMGIIRKDQRARFDAITTEAEFQQLVACQGDQWPDSDILEANGYQVERITKYDQMFMMLKAGRCDYFPRSITEIFGELRNHGDDELMAYERILLSYPFPMYFFVSRNNPGLGDLLEGRLTQYARSGQLRTYMQSHPATQSVFPLEKYQDALIFELDNPDLPNDTPVDDPALWLFQSPDSSGEPAEASYRRAFQQPVRSTRKSNDAITERAADIKSGTDSEIKSESNKKMTPALTPDPDTY